MENNKIYYQPFNNNEFGSKQNRIPALYTLHDGSVIISADMRYGHGQDSPGNIDIAVARSKDGYACWEYTMLNHFDDYADSLTEKESASFIDSAIVQTKTGRIFILCDVYPSGCGYLQSKTGTGYAEIDGKKRFLLTSGKHDDKASDFGFYIGDFEGDLAPVMSREDGTPTEYYVDGAFRLYKNKEAIYCLQRGSENIKVQQSIFYADADLKCFKTTYLCLRYSDDNGKTWSKPRILSPFVKSEKESFLGVGPGRGMVTELGDKRERVMFCVYDNNGPVKDPHFERASIIYSDDNGETWHRGPKIPIKRRLRKTSEAQLVKIDSGDYKALRIYARNLSKYIAYADSTDGGETWTAFRPDKNLKGTKNCMVSLIDTSKKIDGKQVILCSHGGNTKKRADGILQVGLVEKAGKVRWISKYNINKGFFAYSCLTELADGSFAVYYEDEPAHITYMLFSLSDKGEIKKISC